MPKNKDAYTRYRIIDEALRNKQKPFPTIEELTYRCEQILGKRISASSIQKDLYAMRYDEGLGFEAPVEYHKSYKGYYYKDPNFSISKIPLHQDDLYALEFAAGMLRQFRDFPILRQFDTTIHRLLEAVQISRNLYGEEISNIIQVERSASSKGNNYLEFFLQCILDRKEVQFNYFNYSKGRSSQHTLHPYLVREYRNRWYVTGYSPTHSAILTFGLDRISETKTQGKSFRIIDSFNGKKFFHHSFGITVNDLIPQKIELSFTPVEGHYIKAQPLHHTQKVVKDTAKECRISIHVILSHELKMQLLSYGDSVKIIKPLSLREEVLETIRKALKQYS